LSRFVGALVAPGAGQTWPLKLSTMFTAKAQRRKDAKLKKEITILCWRQSQGSFAPSRLYAFALKVVVLIAGASSLVIQAAEMPKRVLKSGRTHLRSGAQAEWDEFKSRKPVGPKFEIRFNARRNEKEQTLLIEQDDVKQEWPVRLNGTNIGKLFLMEAPLVWALPVPARRLVDGENILTIVPPKENDDIIVGPVYLDTRPVSAALSEATLDVTVTENGLTVPCRITVTRSDDFMAAIYATPGTGLVIRPGVIYTGSGRASVQMLAGKYTVYASRGPEYSLAKTKLRLHPGARAQVALSIQREVPTPGLASCDTHVHTFTYSKHGDATLDERMLTLAGEGLELPIAADHNLIVDYSAAARSNGVAQYFTPITGCEVTTAKGHFNAFPIQPGGAVPNFKLEDWPPLMESIRGTPGVQTVVLNHPTDTHSGFCPFAETNFNRVTGENRRGAEFTFDAIELVNSGALRTDLMETFRCWFALLNYGYRVTGVAASDSHDVSRFIVGQGRTYIECNDSKPGDINITTVCRNLNAGKALISLGLLTRITVAGTSGPGDLVTNIGPTISVAVDVLGASWTRADRVELFANGTRIREQMLRPTDDVLKGHVSWTIPRPLHDLHLIAVATGPGVKSPHWAIPRPYQQSSTTWTSRLLGATNPVWLDGDGDGRFTPARHYAKQIVERVGTEAANVIPVLTNFDEAVAAQTASFCHASGKDVRGSEFANFLRRAPNHVQSGFATFANTLN
jgi:hypothetical protein